jgi:hypothetical protein
MAKKAWLTANAAKVHREAIEAGEAALAAATPTPMIVQQRVNPLDDGSPVVKQWIVEDGCCGFADIKVRATTTPNRRFLNGLKKAGLAGAEYSLPWTKDSYAGGYRYWVSAGGQSLDRKEAYARAFAKVLGDYGVTAYAHSRMD